MKKQLIALLTIPVLALTSCNSSKYSLEEVLNFATEKVNTFTILNQFIVNIALLAKDTLSNMIVILLIQRKQLWISIILKMKKVFIHF